MSTSAVTISINVVDNSTAALGKAQASVSALGSAGTAASAQMSGVAAGIDQVGAAGTRMANSYRDATRTVVGAAHEMGIGVSRYFAAEITERFPGLIGMVKSLGTAFLAMGAIEIGAHLVGELQQVYNKFFDVDKAIDDYRKKAADAAEQKIFDIASLETATSLLAQANRQVDDLAAKKKAAGAEGRMGGFIQYGSSAEAGLNGGYGAPDFNPYTPRDAEQQAAGMLQAQKAAEKQGELDHQQRLAQLQAQEGYNSSALQGHAKIAASLELEKQKSAEQLRYTQEQEQWLQKQIIARRDLLLAEGKEAEAAKIQIPQIDANAGVAAKQQADQTAGMRASGERIALARQENEQVIALRNEAVNAGLRGEELYRAQREQAIDAVTRKAREGQMSKRAARAETAAIDLRFDNAKMMRLQAEQEQTQKMARDAQIAGLTGVAKIQAEGANRAADIIATARKSGDFSQLPQRLSINDQRTHDETTQVVQEYYAKLRQMNDEWDGAQLQGYARIEAETVRHVDELKRDFQKMYPGKDVTSDQNTQDTINNAYTNADRERQRLHQQTLIGLQKEEVDAARALLPPWQAAQQQILGQYNERVQKATQEYQAEIAYAKLSAEGRMMAEQDYQAKVQAARQLEQAQMQKAAQSMRDELAGQLSNFFSDPMKYMEKQAESMMMKIIANWVMQLGDFQHNPALQMMFGMGPNVPAPGGGAQSSTLARLMGAGGGSAQQTTQLTYAGNTLGTAGASLINAAADLSAAASTIGRGGFGGAGRSGGSTSGVGGAGWSGGGAYPMASGDDYSAMLSGGSSTYPATSGEQYASMLSGGGSGACFVQHDDSQPCRNMLMQSLFTRTRSQVNGTDSGGPANCPLMVDTSTFWGQCASILSKYLTLLGTKLPLMTGQYRHLFNECTGNLCHLPLWGNYGQRDN